MACRGGEGGKLYMTNDGGINWTLGNSDLDVNGENYSHLSFPRDKNLTHFSGQKR